MINESLFQMYVSGFNKDGEKTLKAICGCVVPSQVVLHKYKSLPPIESLPEKDKNELKEYVREIFSDKTPEEKMNAARIIYTIGTFL